LIGASVLLVALGLTGIVAAWPRERALGTGAEAEFGTGTTSGPPAPSVAPLSTSPTVAEDGSRGMVVPQPTRARETGEARSGTRTTAPSGSARNTQNPPPASSASESPGAAQPPVPDPAERNPVPAQGAAGQGPSAPSPPDGSPPAQDRRQSPPPQGSAPAQPAPASSPPAGGAAPPPQQAPGSANRAPSGGASSTDGSTAGASGQASAPPPGGAAPSAR
jgi:hypothetical protein